jgi:hypothetical protein
MHFFAILSKVREHAVNCKPPTNISLAFRGPDIYIRPLISTQLLTNVIFIRFNIGITIEILGHAFSARFSSTPCRTFS